jgi:hypothetical protein
LLWKGMYHLGILYEDEATVSFGSVPTIFRSLLGYFILRRSQG